VVGAQGKPYRRVEKEFYYEKCEDYVHYPAPDAVLLPDEVPDSLQNAFFLFHKKTINVFK